MKTKNVLLYFLIVALLCLLSCKTSPSNSGNRQAGSETANNNNAPTQIDGTTTPPTIPIKAGTPDGIYIIFDASGSMKERLKDKSRKIDTAKKVLREFVGSDFSGYELALRVYGHRQKDDCEDSELVVPFGSPDAVVNPMKDFIGNINALGRTPITLSLMEALKDFGDRSGEIILISDGIESCNADPCALIREWKEKNIKIKVHVVGFGLDEKSKKALSCISEAAGTVYRDAESAEKLAEELANIRNEAATKGFFLEGFDPTGQPVKVHGILYRNGTPAYQVASYNRYQIEAGDYSLVAGVQTKNGNLYQAVTKNVQSAVTGETRVRVDVPLPPRVKAKFTVGDEKQRGSLITAYQNGKEIFKFRPVDEVFLDEGTYEFRAKPNADNELSVTENFSAGDRKEIVFGMARTVLVTVKMTAEGSGIEFRTNYELWQNGEKRYSVHISNGARVLPGTYDLRLPLELTPYTKQGLVITSKDKQHFDITVPVGHVTIVYLKADGSRDENKRCFITRESNKSNHFRMSGEKVPLGAGTYYVTGWGGKYDRAVFNIKEGESKEVTLLAK
jgi:hypothetical protein